MQNLILSPDELNEVNEEGILFKVSSQGSFKLNGLPEFYQDTYHTSEYILENWSRFFKVLRIIERGLNNHQDLILLQKPEKPKHFA